VKQILSTLALVVFATNAQAQVGHLPQNSPYRDLETSQELTFFGGHYRAGKDPIGIAPSDGGMYGLRYLIHVGGPAFLMARWSHVNSDLFGERRRSIHVRHPLCVHIRCGAEMGSGRKVSADGGLERPSLPAEISNGLLSGPDRRDCGGAVRSGPVFLEGQSGSDNRRIAVVLPVT